MFSCKTLRVFTNPMRVLMLVKSEFYKNVGYSCTVLTTPGCCVYTCQHPSSLLFVLSLQRRRKLNMSDQYTLLLGFPPFRITFGDLKLCLLDSLYSTSEDKAKWQRTNYLQETVGKIILKFSIFFINLVRMLHTVPHNNFGVNLIQTTKCSQEGKVWLIVVVFQFIVL